MKEFALIKAIQKAKAQQLMLAALVASAGLNAAESALDVGIGFGSDDNIFYSNTSEERESFGLIDIDFEYDNDLSDSLTLDIDAVYEDKHVNNQSDARDKFFSGFTQLAYKPGRYVFGVQLDPQYRQFVTSDTDGILIVGEKQRVKTLKVRAFSAVDINDNNAVEVGYEHKAKDYKDSDSDYDADIIDLRLRVRFSQTLRFSFGGEYEQRDYDDRLAVNATGLEVLGEKLEIDRTTWFAKGTWRPSKNQKYSLEYKQRNNEDDFEDYYGHDKAQVIVRTEHAWSNGTVLETKLKFSDKSYDEQLDDDAQSLDTEKSGVDIELSVPVSAWLNNNYKNWYTQFTYEWDDYDSGVNSSSYEKNAYWFAVHRVFD
jgi:hypothetical protein